MKKTARGLAMLSGGLDSTLAAKLLLEQGVEVVGLSFTTGFSSYDHSVTASSFSGRVVPPPDASAKAAGVLGIPFRRIDLIPKLLDAACAPKHGYGAHMNPCIDCRATMLRRAGEIMKEESFNFVSTGEVLGQRPMSQRRDAMRIVERDSGFEGRLLRPLSALLLKPTIPEEEGIVDRSKLLGLSGRSRKPQMKLALDWGITDYPSPAGGCLLTDESYARRFADKLKAHGREGLDRTAMLLLKLGRHFRLRPGLKLIVGRNEGENDLLERMSAGRVFFDCPQVPGPFALCDEGVPSAAEELLCAGLTARYSDGKGLNSVTIEIGRPDGGDERRNVPPLHDEELISSMRI